VRAWLVAALLVLAGCGSVPTSVPTTVTPLSQAELKYKLVDQVGMPLYCDPDRYPVARGDERAQAMLSLPTIQKDQATYAAILRRHGIPSRPLTEAEALTVYQDWKMLKAMSLSPHGGDYRFQGIFVDRTYMGNAIRAVAVQGSIDQTGRITVTGSTPSGPPPCPICLPATAMVETPGGDTSVAAIRPGTLVWTWDGAGGRLAVPVLRTGSVAVPGSHQLVRLVLEDGRTVQASPGHPTADGRRLADLKVGDRLDGSQVTATAGIAYSGQRTYDLLPAGPTGTYWVDGVLLGSTLAG
jgi:hypothetical protein